MEAGHIVYLLLLDSLLIFMRQRGFEISGEWINLPFKDGNVENKQYFSRPTDCIHEDKCSILSSNRNSQPITECFLRVQRDLEPGTDTVSRLGRGRWNKFIKCSFPPTPLPPKQIITHFWTHLLIIGHQIKSIEIIILICASCWKWYAVLIIWTL